MSLENQLGSIASRLRQLEAAVRAIEESMLIEKDKLTQLQNDLISLQSQLRPKE